MFEVLINLLVLCIGLVGLLFFVKLNKVVWSTISYTHARFAVFLVICAIFYHQVGLYLEIYVDILYSIYELDIYQEIAKIKQEIAKARSQTTIKNILKSAYWDVKFMIFKINLWIPLYLESLKNFILLFTKHIIYNLKSLCVLIIAVFVFIEGVLILPISIKFIFKPLCFLLLGNNIFFDLVIKKVGLWYNDHFMVFWYMALFAFFYALCLYAYYTRKQPKEK
jgi:hypothetical protein